MQEQYCQIFSVIDYCSFDWLWISCCFHNPTFPNEWSCNQVACYNDADGCWGEQPSSLYKCQT